MEYLIIVALAATAAIAVIRAGGLARTREIEVAYQAQLDQDAMHYVVTIADQAAAMGVAKPATYALQTYTDEQARVRAMSGGTP